MLSFTVLMCMQAVYAAPSCNTSCAQSHTAVTDAQQVQHAASFSTPDWHAYITCKYLYLLTFIARLTCTSYQQHCMLCVAPLIHMYVQNTHREEWKRLAIGSKSGRPPGPTCPISPFAPTPCPTPPPPSPRPDRPSPECRPQVGRVAY